MKKIPGNYTSRFEYKFNQKYEYLSRHFSRSFRAWLAGKILGERRIYNLFYDASQVGWGIGFEEPKP